MDSVTNRSFNAFSDIVGRRVGNNTNNVKLTQHVIQKHGKTFDASEKIKTAKLLAVIKDRAGL
jgi:hypothetical protein